MGVLFDLDVPLMSNGKKVWQTRAFTETSHQNQKWIKSDGSILLVSGTEPRRNQHMVREEENDQPHLINRQMADTGLPVPEMKMTMMDPSIW